MTDYKQHPIIPPPELRYEWQSESRFKVISVEREDYMIDRAAQWGADQELEACIHWLITGPYGASITCYPDHMIGDLRAARRPKPPSLKEQALEHLEQIHANAYSMGMGFDPSIIRRALEQLND